MAVARRRQLLVRRLRRRKPFPGIRIRIVDFPANTETGYRHESDIRIGKECTTPMKEIDAAYRNVLAQLPAHDIQEIQSFD